MRRKCTRAIERPGGGLPAARQAWQQQSGPVDHQIGPVRFIAFKYAAHAAANIALAQFQQTLYRRVRLYGLQQTHADNRKAGREKQGDRGVGRVGEVAAVARAQLAQYRQRQGDPHGHKGRGGRACSDPASR